MRQVRKTRLPLKTFSKKIPPAGTRDWGPRQVESNAPRRRGARNRRRSGGVILARIIAWEYKSGNATRCVSVLKLVVRLY